MPRSHTQSCAHRALNAGIGSISEAAAAKVSDRCPKKPTDLQVLTAIRDLAQAGELKLFNVGGHTVVEVAK